jgi:hypothetical protein
LTSAYTIEPHTCRALVIERESSDDARARKQATRTMNNLTSRLLLLARVALARAAAAPAASAAAALPAAPYATAAAATASARRTGGGNRPTSRASSASSASRGRGQQQQQQGSFAAPSLSSNNDVDLDVLEAIRRTFPVRVSPVLLDGDYDGDGDNHRSSSSNSSGGKFRSVGDALRRAAASGPDGAMLATRRDVLEFLGVGDEAALVTAAAARREDNDRRAEGEEEEGDEEEGEAREQSGRPTKGAASSSSSPSRQCSPLDLAVPELDAQLRPVAWWVALPSAQARKRAVAAADGRALGAGGRCHVSPGSPKEMVTATRGASRDWWSPKRAQTRRMAAQSGGQAVLVSGLPAGTTATALRGALTAVGVELRRSKVPVRMVGLGSFAGGFGGGGGAGGRSWGGRRRGAGEQQQEEVEGEQQEGGEDGPRKKVAAAGVAAESGSGDAENAAIVWLSSLEEARRCERELHGRDLHLGGSSAASPAAAADRSAAAAAAEAATGAATAAATARVSVRVLP